MSSRRSLHRKANEQTLNWIVENYELREGNCLPRCLLYQHYLDFSRKSLVTPIGAAAFGKLVRQKFPKITTRRLGTRGQSKYHYYGIGIKKSSIYHQDDSSNTNSEISTSRKSINRNSGVMKNKNVFGGRKTRKLSRTNTSTHAQLPFNTGNLIKTFPRANDFQTPYGLSKEKVSTFLLMYRTHCQRLIDAFVCANYEDVENYLNHFWSGIPNHLQDVFDNEFMVNVIECADSVMYKTIEDVFTAKVLQELPEYFVNEIKNIMESMIYWIQASMKTVPLEIMQKRIEIFEDFTAAFKRQLSFVQLAKSCQMTITQNENLALMSKEIHLVDIHEIWTQISTFDGVNEMEYIYCSFKCLLNKVHHGITIDDVTDLVNDIVDVCVINGKWSCLTSRASQLVFAFGALLSGIIRDLTLNSAKSFSFWHLLFITLEEYLLLTVSRSVRGESQSMRRLSIMKQPLQEMFNTNVLDEDENALMNNLANTLSWSEDSYQYYNNNNTNYNYWPITTYDDVTYTCLT